MPNTDELIADLIDALKEHEEDKWETLLFNLWTSGVPVNAKDPKKDEEDDSDDSDDDADDDDDADAEDDDEDEDPKESKKARKAAFDKLREVEKERDQMKKDLAKANRKGMSAAEAAEQRATEAEAERDTLRAEKAQLATNSEIEAVAKRMKFKKPERAKRFVGEGVKTEAEIRTLLKEALDDFPELKDGGTTPPPVDENGKSASTSNRSMNDAIRAGAGR